MTEKKQYMSFRDFSEFPEDEEIALFGKVIQYYGERESREIIWYKSIIEPSAENKMRLLQEDRDFAIGVFHRYSDVEGLKLLTSFRGIPFFERRSAARRLVQLGFEEFQIGWLGLSGPDERNSFVVEVPKEELERERKRYHHTMLDGLNGTEAHPKETGLGTKLGIGFAMMKGDYDFYRF